MNADTIEEFTPTRLLLARERRGMTQKHLAEAARVSDRTIKAYEAGRSSPARDTLDALARALEFPVSFFAAPALEPLTLEAASFRALTKASATVRNRAVAAGTLALEFNRFLSERFNLPQADLPDLRDVDPGRAAEAVRHVWGLGQKPISHVVRLVERHGVRGGYSLATPWLLLGDALVVLSPDHSIDASLTRYGAQPRDKGHE